MKLSTKLKAAMAKEEEKIFSKEDQKYFDDPQWEEAKNLAHQLRFPECQKIVETIDRRYGKIYHLK